jgi:hypothetical protein
MPLWAPLFGGIPSEYSEYYLYSIFHILCMHIILVRLIFAQLV